MGPRARTLELPLLVRSGVFFFFICLGEQDFVMLLALFPGRKFWVT